MLEPELRQIVAPIIGHAQAAHGIAQPNLRTARHFVLSRILEEMRVATCLCSALAAMLCSNGNHAPQRYCTSRVPSLHTALPGHISTQAGPCCAFVM